MFRLSINFSKNFFNSAYESNGLIDGQENDYDNDFYFKNDKMYQTSKHVFYWLYTRLNS